MSQRYDQIIFPALDNMEPVMRGIRVSLLLHAIARQESRFAYRRQRGGGPARGFWQFELGTAKTRGGMYGVFLHPATKLRALLYASSPEDAYQRVAEDDILACQFARLLLWTDPRPLPPVGASQESWDYYLRNWRPGKPHPETWPGLYKGSMEALR